MSTSTYALPVKTALLPNSQHDRPSMQESPVTTSPSGSLKGVSATAHSVHSPNPQNRRTSTSNNALGIDGAKSWDTRPIGPVPSMKEKRARAESNMGRRAWSLQTSFPMSPMSPRTPLSAKPNTVFDEIFNGILLPLPFLAASLAFPSGHSPFAGPSRQPLGTKVEDTQDVLDEIHRHQHFVQAGALSATALLLIGTIARLRLADTVLDRRKEASTGSPSKTPPAATTSGVSAVRNMITRMLSIALPFYASVQLDGVRVALVLLVTIASGMGNTGINARAGIVARLKARNWAVGLLGLLVLCDVVGLLGDYAVIDLLLGYVALFTSAFAVPPPIPYLDRLLGRHMPIIAASTPATPVVPTPPATPRLSGSSRKEPVISKLEDANTSIVAGSLLAGLTTALSYFFSITLNLSPLHVGFSVLALVTIAGLTFFALPVTIGSRGKPGLGAGLLLTVVFAFIQTHDIYGLTVIPFVFAAFCAAGHFVALQSAAPDFGHFRESRRPKHSERNHSIMTAYLLSYCAPGSMLDTIFSERDSRRIAYFGFLNLCFMLVQFFYGFATGSLGLLTDSIHMLFDCVGLAVGLSAAVMSKWPPSLTFPYGYGKTENLSGFANGIFLILVSIEIIFDALHRLNEGYELRRLNELLVVSTLGFLVNIVGLTAFGHAHHGHGHDHGNGHSHSQENTHSHANGHTHHAHDEKHSHNHAHSHNHNDGHNHDHDHDHSHCKNHGKHEERQPSPLPELPPTPFSIPSLPPLTPNPPSPVKTAHSHDHKNENMQGIFLHVLADALGSVAVIFSTLLTKYDGWSGWDPLASCAIAILIFVSAIPLVKSSGSKLLLGLPNEVEYSCRDALQGLSELRGVVGYAGVRVWLADKPVEAAGHHHHGHAHDHSHDAGSPKLTGVIHVISAQAADMEDVGERASQYLKGRGLDLIVQVEVEGTACWCSSGSRAG